MVPIATGVHHLGKQRADIKRAQHAGERADQPGAFAMLHGVTFGLGQRGGVRIFRPGRLGQGNGQGVDYVWRVGGGVGDDGCSEVSCGPRAGGCYIHDRR